MIARNALGVERKHPESLDAAKYHLLEAAQETRDTVANPNLLREHPLLAVGAAVAIGFLVAKVPAARKAAGLAAVWAGKRTLKQYMKRGE